MLRARSRHEDVGLGDVGIGGLGCKVPVARCPYPFFRAPSCQCSSYYLITGRVPNHRKTKSECDALQARVHVRACPARKYDQRKLGLGFRLSSGIGIGYCCTTVQRLSAKLLTACNKDDLR